MNAWKALIAAGDWDAFVRDILEEHYDSAYAAAAARSRPQEVENAKPLFLADTSDETYEACGEGADARVRSQERRVNCIFLATVRFRSI